MVSGDTAARPARDGTGRPHMSATVRQRKAGSVRLGSGDPDRTPGNPPLGAMFVRLWTAVIVSGSVTA